mgnify:CR=1 FL=1
MKLHYKGMYDGDEKSLPSGELEKHKNAIKFKEIDDIKKLMIVGNIIAGIVILIFGGIFVLRAGDFGKISLIGMILSCVIIFPHEFLHAVCFKEDVYMYIAGGGAFVCGTENMSKFRFIFMSLLPNIIFGFIPFIIFLIFPNLNILGTLGFMAISMGVGDYYNVFNALTQMPKGARCFLERQSSYWYMPEDDLENNKKKKK